ncbi:MAG: galactokinase [Sphingomonas sp.]|nr:galactokinase [Sphingomonas sp.]
MTKDAIQHRVAQGFVRAFGGSADGYVRAPGRVNLIGEHTDYNDGFVLPAAIGAETRIAWRATGGNHIDVVAIDFDVARDTIDLKATIKAVGHGDWRNYVRAMVTELITCGFPLRGAEIAITGTIPRGSGLSSSASLEVGLGHALMAAAGITPPAPTRMAQIAQAAENDFVGVRCGIMDQLASAAGQQDHALLIDCRSLDVKAVPIPPGTTIMIIQSGVVRGLVDGHYNECRRECEVAASAMGVAMLRDADVAMLAAHRGDMSAAAFRRARHVITENARTLAAADALAANDLTSLGALMADSHASMRDDFEMTVPPIDAMVAILQRVVGSAGGARMTGGGFGGAVVAVLPHQLVPDARAALLNNYRTPTGELPDIMIETASAGAGPVS